MIILEVSVPFRGSCSEIPEKDVLNMTSMVGFRPMATSILSLFPSVVLNMTSMVGFRPLSGFVF